MAHMLNTFMGSVAYRAAIKDLVIIITGASHDLGAGTVLHFAELNAKMVIVANEEEELEKLKRDALRFYGGSESISVLVIAADIKSSHDVTKIIDNALNTFGRIDALVNCDGIVARGLNPCNYPNEFIKILETTIDRSIYTITMEAVPHLMKTKGSIVCIAGVEDYFVQSMALELIANNIRLNSIDPGKLMKEIFEQGNRNETTYILERATAIKKIADSIAYLATSESFIVNGMGGSFFT